MSQPVKAFGRTIQLFLVDGTPNGLIIASIHGWTGSVPVATQSTFAKLLARPEVDRTGVYILFGPDPNDALSMRAYVGEADSVRDRIAQSSSQLRDQSTMCSTGLDTFCAIVILDCGSQIAMG